MLIRDPWTLAESADQVASSQVLQATLPVAELRFNPTSISTARSTASITVNVTFHCLNGQDAGCAASGAVSARITAVNGSALR